MVVVKLAVLRRCCALAMEMEVLDRRRPLGGPASKRKLPCLDVT